MPPKLGLHSRSWHGSGRFPSRWLCPLRSTIQLELQIASKFWTTHLGVKVLDIFGNHLFQLFGQLLEVERQARSRCDGNQANEGKDGEDQLGHCKQQESSPKVTTLLTNTEWRFIWLSEEGGTCTRTSSHSSADPRRGGTGQGKFAEWPLCCDLMRRPLALHNCPSNKSGTIKNQKAHKLEAACETH